MAQWHKRVTLNTTVVGLVLIQAILFKIIFTFTQFLENCAESKRFVEQYIIHVLIRNCCGVEIYVRKIMVCAVTVYLDGCEITKNFSINSPRNHNLQNTSRRLL